MLSLLNHVGHPGTEKTIKLVKVRFYWPAYTFHIAAWIEKCDWCLRRKFSTAAGAPLANIQTSYPLELVSNDFLKVEACSGGIRNILVITDHFAKYAVAVPTKTQTAKTTTEALVSNFIVHYGVMAKLLSDQGSNFEGELIQELCKLLGIEKVRTTPYHPQCNGMSEGYNRTLLSMLGTLEPEHKQNWKKYLSSLVFPYNAMKHESMGYSHFS